MDEDTFLAEVARRLSIPRERAEQVTSAVLQRLRERIGDEAVHMDAQLPAGLKRFRHEPGVKEEIIRLHKDEFFGRIPVAAGLPEAEVPSAVKVVFKVLQKALKTPPVRSSFPCPES
jgi:uncharacterized protein (DUF2267 family)